MNRSKWLKSGSALLFGSVVLFSYQNCSSQGKMTFTLASVEEKFGSIKCSNFGESHTSCLSSAYGLIGKLYYFLDKRTNALDIASSIPNLVYDKENSAVAFPSGLTSVNMLISKGYTSDTYILMQRVSTPAISFSGGFQMEDGSVIKDAQGKTLIEAFALDLKGKLKLGPGMQEGLYEIATLSDDGSILELDTNGDGQYDFTLNSDGLQSPKLSCLTKAFTLNESSRLPLRLRYYQGPRQTIALTLVMRKISSVQDAGKDIGCGVSDGAGVYWFGGISSDVNYKPEYNNSPFGDLLRRGWFVPPKEAFALPDTL